MSVENLSEEQVARYGRFAEDPSPLELEEFFRLDGTALELTRIKRRGYNRLGWAGRCSGAQCGCSAHS